MSEIKEFMFETVIAKNEQLLADNARLRETSKVLMNLAKHYAGLEWPFNKKAKETLAQIHAMETKE